MNLRVIENKKNTANDSLAGIIILKGKYYHNTPKNLVKYNVMIVRRGCYWMFCQGKKTLSCRFFHPMLRLFLSITSRFLMISKSV